MFASLLSELQLATAVLIHGGAASARRLFEVKERFRDLEEESRRDHFDRMCAGDAASIEPSALALDLLRDLKRVAGHVGATAEPLLIANGILRASRLEAAAWSAVSMIAGCCARSIVARNFRVEPAESRRSGI